MQRSCRSELRAIARGVVPSARVVSTRGSEGDREWDGRRYSFGCFVTARFLRDKARGAGAGDFFEPVLLRQRDEVGGLAVARGIVAEHGGWIEAESEVGRGSR